MRAESLVSSPAAPAARPSVRVRCLGFVSRRERWGLTWRGHLCVIAAMLSATLALVLGIHPFLATTRREPAEYLAVEGWVQDYAIRTAAAEFNTAGYRAVFATGGPVHGLAAYRTDDRTAASLGANRLIAAGVAVDRVHPVPSLIIQRDRTYGSAVALRDWLQERHIPVRHLNILTADVHARRTRLLFQEAFGGAVAVGVIAVPNPDRAAGDWWRSSEGVREVLGEAIAYAYAKFFFFPPARAAAPPPAPPS